MSETQVAAETKVKITRDGDVAILTLADPATMNAAGVDMAADLTAALKSVIGGANPARAVVLTGEGRGFCSGANLTSVGSRAAPAPGERPGAGDALKTVYNPLITLIRDLPIPIVTGEAIYSKEAWAQCFAARAADIINPDICNCGGISAMLDIAAMAQPHAVAVAPHNYNSTLVGLAATVQLSAMIPNFWIAECFVNLKPACDEIAVTPLTVDQSFVDLPVAPGIGIDLDVSRLRAKPYRDMGTRMGRGLRSYTEEFPRKHYAVAATRTGY